MPMQTRKSTALPLLGLIPFLATLALFGCSPKNAGEAAPTVTVQVATAEKEAIESKVTADATLFPRDQAAIVPKISAPVKAFFVDRGSHVKAGQILAELEDSDLLGAYTENQGGYQQAEASYHAALEKAAQDLAVAKEELNLQQKTYDSRVSLYQQGAVSAKDVADAKIALTQAQGQYQAAQKAYDLKSAEGQLTTAKGKSASAAAQLSYAKIVSPISGVVTDRPFFPGETPPAGAPLITVMDISQVTARAHIAQAEASELKVGDSAEISAPGLDHPVPGKVTLVSPALDPNSNTVEVWVQAVNPHEQLRPGTSVRVSIVAQKISAAIVIPVAALLTTPDGSISIYTLDAAQKPHKQAVKVGIRSGEDAQIIGGVKEGDTVITVGAFELDNEDEDVRAKTKIVIQTPKAPSAGEGAAGGGDDQE